MTRVRAPLWRFSIALILLSIVVGCTAAEPQAPTKQSAAVTPAGTAEQPGIKVQVPGLEKQRLETQASPAAASPVTAASPQVAPQRSAPEGRFVYLWNVSPSPTWFDPQENPQLLTPYGWQYAIHDALVKHMPDQPFAASLAESYEIAQDFRSATFKLREGIKFHNGEPVTPDDVIFTFENYRGANAQVLHGKTEKVEALDNRTVKFTFTEPFLDFQVLYGSPASGAGWVVPKKYYQEVGPDGFKRHPIGAGPYKFVRFQGDEVELEAFTDYWRKTPAVKTLIMRGVPEATTRLAQAQTGEGDIAQSITGPLIEVAQNDPNLQLAAVRSSAEWLEFVGWEDPANPFHDPRVRQAASLALDRQAISEAEEAGLSTFEGNWIPENWPGAIQRPKPPYDPEKAKQLLAEAGYPNGFETTQLTPLPPYTSLGERVTTMLRDVGIRVNRVDQMERGAFFAKLAEGKGAFAPGIILHFSASPGDAASRIRAFATCDGVTSRICDPEIEARFEQYETSTNPQEREQVLNELQAYILDNHILVPLYRQSFISAVGPRMANEWSEIMGAIPQYVYLGPYEDIELKK